MVEVTVLKPHQFCVIVNPIGADGQNLWGVREMRVGPKSFFLLPGKDGMVTVSACLQQEAVCTYEKPFIQCC